MADNSSPVRFKAEMPHIPGVADLQPKPPRLNPLVPLILGVLILGVVFVFTSRWISRTHPAEATRSEPVPQIEVPSPPPDPDSLLPHADASNPVIATVAQLAKPWSSLNFFVKNPVNGEDIPAIIVRLPTGSATQASGYWAFSRKAPYGPCELEYVSKLSDLRDGYGYQAATHPLAGNPCSHTLYDPLKTANLPGSVWIRGAIVQGSDIRPPYGVEIKVQGKQILAVRSE
ncbi:MAG TPA: hypothetical protein VGF19_08265 [Candidatus Acidoferrum sp.]